MQSMTFISQNT